MSDNLPAKINAEALISQGIEKGIDVSVMERLLAMREKLKQEDAKDQFFRALSMFQARCPVIPKTSPAGSGNFQYHYAPLEVIIKHIGPLLEQCGLSFTFDTDDSDTTKTTICIIHHIAGHSESSRFRVPIDAAARMNDTQKQGSAGTYGKRYALCNALGILTGEDDDDGHGSGGKQVSGVPSTQNSGTKPLQSVPDCNGGGGAIISNLEKKEGEKNGKPWTLYSIFIDKEKYSTFDKKIGEAAADLFQKQIEVNFTFEKEARGKRLTGITVANAIPPADEVFDGK